MSAGIVPDHTYTKQEGLRLETAAHSFGVVYFRLFNLFAIPVLALLCFDQISKPLWFWSILAFYIGVNLTHLILHFFALSKNDKWWMLVFIDAVSIFGLSIFSGGFESGFRYLYLFLILYSIIRLSRIDTIKITLLCLSSLFVLYWVGDSPTEDLLIMATVVVGMMWFSCEITNLINSSHHRVMRHLEKQIESTNIIKSHQKLLQKEILDRKNSQVALAAARDTAVAANNAKTRFMANMSHELRTPLNAILGYSELLREEVKNNGSTNSAEDLSRIHNAGKHLLSVLGEILDTAMIEENKVNVCLEEVDLAHAITKLIDTATPLAEENNNHIKSVCAPDIGIVVTDQTKISQVLLNLMSNACKFTFDGTITIDAKKMVHDDQDWISITVTDDGIGIAEEHLSSIFDAFSQADESSTRKYGGVGLGLAISRNYCRLLGGDLTVESEVKKGSKFSVRILVNDQQSIEI